jgi:amidase
VSEIVERPAHALSDLIASGETSCVEVMAAHLDRIEALNPTLNAIVALRDREQLLSEAAAYDAELARGQRRGWLHGLPVAVKDLQDVAGLPTSKGFFRDAAPAAEDGLLAGRLRAAGAIVVGKTNTPEFGLGSHTFNGVHGTTLNPWDTTRSAGGSSGGAAVAVATRMLPLADGSDFGGSLRNPTGWTNTLGLRPSFGRVPNLGDDGFVSHGGVDGPIARDPRDLALLLGTLAGPDPRDPLALAAGAAAPRPATGRVGWLGDLDGYLPVEPGVLAVCESALGRFGDVDLTVEPATLPRHGSFDGTDDLWPTWLVFRHWLAGAALSPVYADPASRARLKPEARYEVEGLAALSAADVLAMSRRRTDLYRGLLGLFESVDFLVLPTAQLAPFDATWTWPREVAGRAMSSYHRWMEVSTVATLAGLPALAMPAGFDADGLPVGLQVIGRPRDDASLLALAERWETATGLLRRAPSA